ncbi:MAG TPA: MGMT family protein [Polyangiaceae bacterium]
MKRTVTKTDTVALLITKHVPRGKVTTYGALSEAFYGHGRGSKAIGAMMKTWAAQDPRNWSHRVINDDGSLPDVDLSRERLLKEGVAFDEEGKVVLEKQQAELPPFKKAE